VPDGDGVGEVCPRSLSVVRRFPRADDVRDFGGFSPSESRGVWSACACEIFFPRNRRGVTTPTPELLTATFGGRHAGFGGGGGGGIQKHRVNEREGRRGTENARARARNADRRRGMNHLQTRRTRSVRTVVEITERKHRSYDNIVTMTMTLT